MSRKSPRKRRNRKEQALHPLVAGLVAGEGSLLELLRRFAPDADEPLPTMLRLREVLGGEGDMAVALSHAEQAEQAPADLEVRIIFYSLWSVLARHSGRLAEAAVLARRQEALAAKSKCPEIAAMAKSSRGNNLHEIGRQDEAERIQREALEALESSSHLYPKYLYDLATLVAIRGKGAEILEELEAFAGSVTVREGRTYFDMAHNTETGRYMTALPLLEKCLENRKHLLMPEQGLRTYKAILYALGGRELEGIALPGLVLRALLEGRAEDALELARRQVAERATFLYGSSMDSHNLVRAELACGHAEAARRMIRLRRERGNTHYLDDFFLARADLLEGKEQDAAGRYSEAVASCLRYDALPRLELEIRLAPGLSAVGLAKLSRGVYAAGAGGGERKGAGWPAEPAAAESRVTGAGRLVGVSAHLAEVRASIRMFAEGNMPVLITGETGTGKELAARALHEESPRRNETFLAVNCGAISEGLLESEFFGHARGAFTGAGRAHTGVFESAGEGSVFLDEIGDVTPRLQVALLRVLESGEIRPVGSSRTRRVSCRVIAATNADLEARVQDGSFRKDLYFRLCGASLLLRPLRERREDILSLADHYLSLGREDGRRPVISEALKSELGAGEWPGNVRQLRSEIELMRLLHSDKLQYDAGDMAVTSAKAAASPGSATAAPPAAPRSSSGLRPGNSPLRRREAILELFRQHGKLTRAEIAAAVQLSPDTVTRYLKELASAGEIAKVMPTASPRSHYFESCGDGG